MKRWYNASRSKTRCARIYRKLQSARNCSGYRRLRQTVVQQTYNAVWPGIPILLGLRGQAKSRIIRQLTNLLDDQIPIIAGSEVNDNPFGPISAYGRQMIDLHGESAHIAWVSRDARFVEKLATPDVTIADIIGDVDPIKAAKGGHLLSEDNDSLCPFAAGQSRCLAINELPIWPARFRWDFQHQAGSDVQIKGYPVRLPLE